MNSFQPILLFIIRQSVNHKFACLRSLLPRADYSVLTDQIGTEFSSFYSFPIFIIRLSKVNTNTALKKVNLLLPACSDFL